MSFTSLVMTNVSVCDGYKDNPAITFHKSNDGQQLYANFKVAQRVYDANAKDEYRYNNWRIKCIGVELVEKIKRMGIKGGSFIDLVGAELDMDKFPYDGKEFNLPVLKIRNPNDIRYSDILPSDRKTNSSDKPVEPDQVVDIAASGFFKNLPQEMFQQIQPQIPTQPMQQVLVQQAQQPMQQVPISQMPSITTQQVPIQQTQSVPAQVPMQQITMQPVEPISSQQPMQQIATHQVQQSIQQVPMQPMQPQMQNHTPSMFQQQPGNANVDRVDLFASVT